MVFRPMASGIHDSEGDGFNRLSVPTLKKFSVFEVLSFAGLIMSILNEINRDFP
jgi:hypothetical protein